MCEVLHISFVQLNFIILESGKQVLMMCRHVFFCALCKNMHNDVVKHHSTIHKTQGIVIIYVILFDLKNVISVAQFNFFEYTKKSLSNIGNVCLFFPLYLSKPSSSFMNHCLIEKQFVSEIKPLVFFYENWCTV